MLPAKSPELETALPDVEPSPQPDRVNIIIIFANIHSFIFLSPQMQPANLARICSRRKGQRDIARWQPVESRMVYPGETFRDNGIAVSFKSTRGL